MLAIPSAAAEMETVTVERMESEEAGQVGDSFLTLYCQLFITVYFYHSTLLAFIYITVVSIVNTVQLFFVEYMHLWKVYCSHRPFIILCIFI